MSSATLPGPAAPADRLARADELERDERFLEAAEALEQLDRTDRNPLVDVRIVQLRHQAFRELRSAAPPHTGDPTASAADAPTDPFPGEVGVPEVPARDLDPELLRGALAHHGCLLVRGLLEAERCASLREDIDRAFLAFDERGDHPVEETAPWYAALELDEGTTPIEPVATAFLRTAGGVYGPYSPRTFVDYRSALAEAGLIDVVARHLGEVPTISVNKCVLRRIGGGANPTWHQDALYLGDGIRSVNLWLSLSHCGADTDVMGLDLLPGPRHALAEMGTHDAVHPQAVSEQVVADLARRSGRPVVRPEFAPGDGILFDHYFLHRSDVRPLPTERYAIESWFFAPSAYPDNQIPVVAG